MSINRINFSFRQELFSLLIKTLKWKIRHMSNIYIKIICFLSGDEVEDLCGNTAAIYDLERLYIN